MAEFAGYNMPISYTGINDEHTTVRRNAGIFDVSHMGEFILKGIKRSTLYKELRPMMPQNLRKEKLNIAVLQMQAGV